MFTSPEHAYDREGRAGFVKLSASYFVVVVYVLPKCFLDISVLLRWQVFGK